MPRQVIKLHEIIKTLVSYADELDEDIHFGEFADDIVGVVFVGVRTVSDEQDEGGIDPLPNLLTIV